MNPQDAITALGLGIAGAGHCLGMCGGVALSLGFGQGGTRSLPIQLGYHSGRVLSYTALGAAAGFSLELAGGSQPVVLVLLRYLAGFMLIAMGCYIAGWWRILAVMERAGASLWQPVRRFSSRWLPVQHPGHALALGFCWGAMPCGLIYSSLAWSATAASAVDSGLLMLLFGLGTLPAMLAATLSGARMQSWLRSPKTQQLFAIALIASGCWTLYMVGGHPGHHPG